MDTILDGAFMRGCSIYWTLATGISLRGADLRDADLRGATLEEANLQGADLRGANLGVGLIGKRGASLAV